MIEEISIIRVVLDGDIESFRLLVQRYQGPEVYQYEQREKSSLFDIQWLVATITAHPMVQAAMIAIGAIVGFIRLAITLHILLYT